MLLLTIYIVVAVGFSFLCSIAEAVLLSITPSFIAAAEQEEKTYAGPLRELKEDINSPLAVILTLNTIAHTMGAAGAGAQAAAVFGSVYLGVFSAVLTLLILVFSEIIPKALGAHYWRQLAPATVHALRFFLKAFYPFVWLSNLITRGITHGSEREGLSRTELAAMAAMGEREGVLNRQESLVLRNLFGLRDMQVRSAMTPRSVVFSMPEQDSVAKLLDQHNKNMFSRIPVYAGPEDITGFVLRDDLLEARNRGEEEQPLANYRRELPAVLDASSMLGAFEVFSNNRSQILLVVDEYGTTQGILTLEDVLETLIGIEIMDESDTVVDMQALARRLGTIRRRKMGLEQPQAGDDIS